MTNYNFDNSSPLLRSIQDKIREQVASRGGPAVEEGSTTASIVERPATPATPTTGEAPADDVAERIAQRVATNIATFAVDPEDLASRVFNAPVMQTPDSAVASMETLTPLDELLAGSQTRAAIPSVPRMSTQTATAPEMGRVDPLLAEGSTRGATPVSQQQGEDFDLEASIESRLVELEGFESRAYKPVESEEYYTIGYGHYGQNVRPGQTISESEARELLRQDIQERLPAIRRAFPEYDNFSPELQVELAQGWFRGDVSGSPKTRELINEGRFEEAAVEFLNNDEYRRAEELGKPGIIPRMEAIAAAIRAEAGRSSDQPTTQVSEPPPIEEYKPVEPSMLNPSTAYVPTDPINIVTAPQDQYDAYTNATANSVRRQPEDIEAIVLHHTHTGSTDLPVGTYISGGIRAGVGAPFFIARDGTIHQVGDWRNRAIQHVSSSDRRVVQDAPRTISGARVNNAGSIGIEIDVGWNYNDGSRYGSPIEGPEGRPTEEQIVAVRRLTNYLIQQINEARGDTEITTENAVFAHPELQRDKQPVEATLATEEVRSRQGFARRRQE